MVDLDFKQHVKSINDIDQASYYKFNDLKLAVYWEEKNIYSFLAPYPGNNIDYVFCDFSGEKSGSKIYDVDKDDESKYLSNFIISYHLF